jgi:hypothetical protein
MTFATLPFSALLNPAQAELGRALSIGLWVMLAAVLGIGGIYAALAVKRWMQREEPVETLTLQDLREMRARGQITEEEYETLRAGILGSAGTRTARDEGARDSGDAPTHS